MNARRFVLGMAAVAVLAMPMAQGKSARPGIVAGQVVDSQGEPVVDAFVVLVLRMGLGDNAWRVETTSDAAGKFQLSPPSAWLLPGAFYHDRTVWVHAPGYAVATAYAGKQLAGASDEPLRVQLAAEEPVEYRVLAPDGTPLAGCVVQPHHWHSGRIPPAEILERLAATANAEGVAKMSGVTPALVRRVDVVSEAYGTQRFVVGRPTVGADRRLDLGLAEVGTLAGRLIADSPAAVSGVRVAVQARQSGGGGAEGGGETITDAEGHFRIDRLATGRYGMYVEAPSGIIERPRLPEIVVVEAGETSSIEIPFEPTVVVRGSVVARGASQPVANAFVSIRHGSWIQSESVLTDSRGAFEARVLPGQVGQSLIRIPDAFEHWMRIRTSNTAVEVTLDDSPYELPPLEITKAKTVEATIVDADGQPVPDVQINATDDDVTLAWSRSNEHGKAMLKLPEDAEPTTFRLSLRTTRNQEAKVLSQDPLVLQFRDPNTLARVTEAVAPTPDDKRRASFPEPQEEIATLIVAKNTLIFEGVATNWADLSAELERRSGVRGGNLSTVHYYRTHGAYDDPQRTEEARNWATMLSETTGVRVQEAGLILNRAAERYDNLQPFDAWPPGAENPVAGRVVDAAGAPVANAVVVLLVPSPPTSRMFGPSPVYLRDGQVTSPEEHIVAYTAADGRFSFDFPPNQATVLVTAAEGLALCPAAADMGDIALDPWSRVTATIPQNKKLGIQTLSLSISAMGGGGQVFVHMSDGSTEKPQREFEVAFVPSGQQVSVSRTLWRERNGGMMGQSQGQPYRLTTRPGMTHHLQFEPLGAVEE